MWPAFLVAALALAGCGGNDLGKACELIQPTANGSEPLDPAQMNPSLDYISTGGADCEDFTCVDTAGDTTSDGVAVNGYCSRRCIEDAQCTGGQDTNLVCRELNLDDDFINTLRERLGEEKFRQLFGDITVARFCAHPAQ